MIENITRCSRMKWKRCRSQNFDVELMLATMSLSRDVDIVESLYVMTRTLVVNRAKYAGRLVVLGRTQPRTTFVTNFTVPISQTT